MDGFSLHVACFLATGKLTRRVARGTSYLLKSSTPAMLSFAFVDIVSYESQDEESGMRETVMGK